MDRTHTLLVAEIRLEERGGSIHAYSDDIPGLHIVGTNRDDVLEDVIGGIKFLYKEVHGLSVTAEWAASPAEVFKFPQPQKNVEHVVMKPTFERLAA